MSSVKIPGNQPLRKPHCLVQSVADVIASEPNLETVMIDRARLAISIETTDESEDSKLAERISAKIQNLQQPRPGPKCGLLNGAPDCSHCESAVPPDERQAFMVKHEARSTTITRSTPKNHRPRSRWRDLPWPKVVNREMEIAEDEHHLNEWKFQMVAAALCAGFGLTGFFLGNSPYAIPAYLVSFLSGSWFAFEEVLEKWRAREVDVHFLMLVVAAGSASIGAWGEGAMLLFLFSFSGALEHYAMGRTQREIRSLFKTAPKSAITLDENGREIEIPVDQLQPGMRLLIKPGEQYPVDGEVSRGDTASDESNLTGEAVPVEKRVGDLVLAGTINLWGAVEIIVLRTAHESSLQKIIRLIREAQHLKAPAQRFTDRFGTGYTYAILGISILMFFVWWLLLGHRPLVSSGEKPSALYRTMTLLVVASPCALVLSIPSAILAAIAWGARRGVLFRGGAAVEKLAEVQVVALDKTGTLTTGDLEVDSIESFPSGREEEVGRLAFSMERLSQHPLARAITRYGKQRRWPPLPLENFESFTGLGVQARHGQTLCRLGKAEWMDSVPLPQVPESQSADKAGQSEIWLAAGHLRGRILLRDNVRPEARVVLEKLHRTGLVTIVLTGDRSGTALLLKQHLPVGDVRAELKPEDKVRIVHQLTQQGRRVAMVGDGVNDAPSLAAAHVGVAMGARGSDAALEQADVVLMHDRLENFLAAYQLSRRARAVIRQNLAISLGTVLGLVLFALFSSLPLTLGVLGHEGSTVVVVLNSLRLLFGAKDKALTASLGPQVPAAIYRFP